MVWQLFTRRREEKDNIPRPSFKVRDLSAMSDATCARMMNLKDSARAEMVDLSVDLPETPILTGQCLRRHANIVWAKILSLQLHIL